MTKRRKKVLDKCQPELRKRLEYILHRILNNQRGGLDIKQLTGHDHLYRCRVGKLRILFRTSMQDIIILDIDTRGDAYKGL